jgi:hypothetical protein
MMAEQSTNLRRKGEDETTYVYGPLETGTSIRLIDLLPGAEDDPLACHIRHVDLSDQPDYEAISYVWGSEVDKPLILCDDGTTGVRITQNLVHALRRFRPLPPTKSRTLWTDSICINQCDGAEKARQVPLMGEIYGKASEVLIWLGL